MADKFLNLTDLVAIKAWIEGKFALDADLDDLAAEVAEIIAEGGEPNVIEIIKKNGAAITPDANKAVDISVPTVAKSGSGENEKVTIAEGQNSFDVPTVGAMEDYVSEHGGVIQKIKNNGTEMPIDSSDKSVNFTNATSSANGLMSATDKAKLDAVEAGAQANVQSDWNQATSTEDDFIKNKPTKVSDFTNDSGFQTAQDVTTAITTALANGNDPYQTESDVDDKIAAQVASAVKIKGSVATYADLPASGNKNGDMYDVTSTGMNYVWIVEGGTGRWDEYAPTVDTSVLWTSQTGQSNTLVAATVAEVNAVLEPTS